MERRTASRTQAKAYATLILLACCPCASALNPSLDISQYAHFAWPLRDGFFKGHITSITQTPDGYLWLGTEFGLLRFDGVRSVPWQPPTGEHLPGSYISGLLAARDGRLWIGTHTGLASWKDGKLTHYAELVGQGVGTLLEDREGTVWAGGWATPTGRLCAIQSGSARCYGEDGSLGHGVLSLFEDGRGNLWAGSQTGLWRWKPGPPKLYPRPEPEIRALIEGDNGALIASMPSGIRQLVDGKVEAYSLPGPARQFKPNKLLRDRDGGLWIGTTDRGLLHVHQGSTDQFTRSDSLSSDFVGSLFEDREGNIWVATLDGLDRFRDFAVPTISVKQGLSRADVWSVLAARDGNVWLGTRDGLNKWNDGRITIYRKRSSGLPDDVESLFQDNRGRIWASTNGGFAYLENGRFIPVSGLPAGVVHSIAGDGAGNLWIGDEDQGLFHLRQGNVVEQIPWARLGRKDFAYALYPDPVQGGLWLGFYLGGVAYFKDGQVRASYAGPDGLGEGRVENFQLDRDGTLWAATEGGLSRVKNGHVATLTTQNGLPCDTVHWTMEDNDHSFWLYMACGLVRIARSELDTWVNDSRRTIQSTVFDSFAGVRNRALPGGYSPRVSKSADGKLWFVTDEGVSVIDPRHLPFNKLPPPVHIEQITADRKKYELSPNLRLPPLVRDLEIEYTALSLVAPEKIHFRYKLEGHDPDWQDAGNERKKSYTDLPPRNYRFRVMASNNSGVWNESGASFDFSIAPAYYQTRWFRASSVAAFLALLWAVYRLRLYQFAREFAAQTRERTRIARDIHDTLLQSFQASLIQMQRARNHFSRSPEEAIRTLDNAIGSAEQAIVEGRDAIQDLRPTATPQSDLEHLLTVTGQELAKAQESNGTPPMLRVTVEGPHRSLSPNLQDEVYRIGREVLRNAFRHAQASHIEAEIRYDNRKLRLRIRDDGKGIDRDTMTEGARAGHWGLPGARERATRIGARLDFWSEAGAGTEVELTVPASRAYAKPRAQRRFGFFRKKDVL
jgi:signal transduction histidine kinase/ligand-binding sensor domain-containing protein